MSLRPEISGFDFSCMQKLFGCKDAQVLSRLEAHWNDFWPDLEETENSQGFEYLNDIVSDILIPMEQRPRGVMYRWKIARGKAPRPPREEDTPLILATIAMAYFEQEHLATDSNMWKSYFIDYASGFLDNTPISVCANEWDEMCNLLGFLLGRPLFGQEFQSDRNIYGYLSKAEVKKLLHFFDKFPQLERDEEQFGPELKQWLAEIADQNKDLWFFAQ